MKYRVGEERGDGRVAGVLGWDLVKTPRLLVFLVLFLGRTNEE